MGSARQKQPQQQPKQQPKQCPRSGCAGGTRINPGGTGYGVGQGHYEQKTIKHNGDKTMLCGVLMCCCCGLPCGFCLQLDTKHVQVWVVDGPNLLAPRQNAMADPLAKIAKGLEAFEKGVEDF